MNKETNELGTKPIGALLMKYSLPAVIAMLVNAIYNVVDRIFIGQYVGDNALAGLTIAFPVMIFIFACASLIGEGGSALLAIRLGEQDKKGANNIFGNTLSFGLIVSAFVSVLVFFNLERIILLFGGTADTTIYAMDYMHIILGGFIFQMTSFILSSSVRTEGHPLLAMTAMISSALLNILLDYIFIGIMDLGVVGAAYGTILSQFFGLGILLSFYIRKKSQLRLCGKDLIPQLKVGLQIMTIGFASFISTVGVSIALALLNKYLNMHGGTAAVTSMGAINSLYTLFIMPLIGVTQGMQPIIGYNHGAKKRARVTKTVLYGMTTGIIFSTIVFALLELFPHTFIGMFLEDESKSIDIAINGLRIYILMLPVLALNLMGITYFQATAKGQMAMTLGILRQFVFLIPILMILPRLYQLNGVWMSVPIADGLAIIVTVFLLVRDCKKQQAIKSLVPEKVS